MKGLSVPRASGVYRFYVGDACIYVGSSQNLRDRITSNRYLKLADRWEYDLVPLEELDATEQRLIDELKPSLNRRRVSSRPDRGLPKMRVTVAFDGEDHRNISEIHEALRRKQGLKVSAAEAIRYALRQAVAQIGRKK